MADANHDGIVNIFDINLISASWGLLPGGAAGGGSGSQRVVSSGETAVGAQTGGDPVVAPAVVEGALPGDADGDGTVGFFDLMLVSTHFGQGAAVSPSADVNGDRSSWAPRASTSRR